MEQQQQHYGTEQSVAAIASTRFAVVAPNKPPAIALSLSPLQQRSHNLLQQSLSASPPAQPSSPNQIVSSAASSPLLSPAASIATTTSTSPFLSKSPKDQCIGIKQRHICVLLNNLDKISVLFDAKLIHAGSCCVKSNGQLFVKFRVVPDCPDANPTQVAESIQAYIDSLTLADAEDSSYDSDDDADDVHEQVSRTSSDTLGQEFAEYVNQQTLQTQDRSPGYTHRVEFALKLGYTERLVQAALARLGPNPAQNELLAELIKLGAQPSNKGEFIGAAAAGQNEFMPSVSLSGGGSSSSNNSSSSTGSNQSNGGGETNCEEINNNGLRPIVIDGSNVAMSHGNKEVFSCRGIKLCVDWFLNRGHKDITVFVPKWRKENSRPDNPIKEQDLLGELEKERQLVFTPSRFVAGKRQVCYDDRYILKLAIENDGIVVSNDNYRDLITENCDFKKVVGDRLLMYSFVNDRFMPPDDPLGRSGPTLDNFLRIQPKKGDPPPPCPYGKKCTYGNKCKFHHPERGTGPHKSVTERLSEHAARHLSARNSDAGGHMKPVVQGKSLSVPLSNSGETSPIGGVDRRKPLSRTRSGMPDCSYSGIESQHQQQHQVPCFVSLQQPIWDQSSSSTSCIQETQQQQQRGNFPKSHSIENISREATAYGGPPNMFYAVGPLRQQVNAQQQQQQTQQQLQQQQINQNQLDTDDCSNVHRKLRRQLTLNPAGCDPRILQMQRIGMNHQQQQHSTQHRPLAPSLSGPRQIQLIHQNVTRISSAPDPARPWQSGPPPASTSEPQINLWPQQHRAATPILSTQDHRRHLQYHLASIFPEEQVQTAMQMYPDETNAQKICAAILNMFPKM